MGGSKAGGLPTLPFPLSLPSPFPFPLSFQTNQWEGRSDPVRGKFPGFPPTNTTLDRDTDTDGETDRQRETLFVQQEMNIVKLNLNKTSCAGGRRNMPPHSVTLTFDLLTLKVVSESLVMWATSLPILIFLGLSVLDLGPMYVHTDRQTSDGIIA